MLTHGEKWLEKAVGRIVGYCKTRGWKCGAARKIAPQQYELWITDRLGQSAPLAFEMYAHTDCDVLDDYGTGKALSATVFDAAMLPFNLAGKPLHSKRQLELSL